MKHDEIVLALTDEKLTLLLSPYFGNKGAWTRFLWVIEKEIKNWNPLEISTLYDKYEPGRKVMCLEAIRTTFLKDQLSVSLTLPEKALKIKKTFEYPLIKGQGQFKVTKGFLDVVVHCQPVTEGEFSTFKDSQPIEFVIEVKTENDFKDMGAILRQIKEYKEYYDYGCEKWRSDIIGDYGRRIKYCLLSTKIPLNIKSFFADQGILCLELDSLKEVQDGNSGEAQEK